MSTREKWVLEKTKIILVEGVDEVNFFKAMLEHIGKNDVQVKDYAGKMKLHTFLPTLVNQELFPDLEALMVVRDTDDEPIANIWNSVQDSLRDAGINRPREHAVYSEGKPRVAVFLMPDGTADGMLEDLCRRAVQDDPATPLVDAYFLGLERVIKDFEATGQEPLAARLRQKPNVRAKAWAHAFLASRPKPDKRVGEAALADYWPFDALAFEALLTLLRSM